MLKLKKYVNNVKKKREKSVFFQRQKMTMPNSLDVPWNEIPKQMKVYQINMKNVKKDIQK